MKFEMIEPFLLTKKWSRVWRSVINFVDKFQYKLEDSSCQQEEDLLINTVAPKRKCVGEYDFSRWLIIT